MEILLFSDKTYTSTITKNTKNSTQFLGPQKGKTIEKKDIS